MFSFYQIHPTSINKTNGASSSEDGATADVNTTNNSWKQRGIFRSLTTLKIIGKAQPRNPSNGCILSFLVLLATIGIIGELQIGFHYLEREMIISTVNQCITREIIHSIPKESTTMTYNIHLICSQDTPFHLLTLIQRKSTHKSILIQTQSSLFATIKQLDIFATT
jgi:hypothetical protein